MGGKERIKKGPEEICEVRPWPLDFRTTDCVMLFIGKQTLCDTIAEWKSGKISRRK